MAAKINSGVIFFKQDKPEKAAGYFMGALESEPGNKSALTMWALSLETLILEQRAGITEATTRDDSLKIEKQAQGTLEQAAEVYLMAIEAHPDDKDFPYNLGVLYAQQLKDFHLATTRLSMNDLDGAQPSLEKAIELEPDNPDIWYLLGIVYVKQGMKTEGEEAFKKAEELRGGEE